MATEKYLSINSSSLTAINAGFRLPPGEDMAQLQQLLETRMREERPPLVRIQLDHGDVLTIAPERIVTFVLYENDWDFFPDEDEA